MLKLKQPSSSPHCVGRLIDCLLSLEKHNFPQLIPVSELLWALNLAVLQTLLQILIWRRGYVILTAITIEVPQQKNIN
jgi:hypothetical protein